jgi:hypothetical protein
MQNLDHVLTHDIPDLMAKFSAEISALPLFADSGVPSGMWVRRSLRQSRRPCGMR